MRSKLSTAVLLGLTACASRPIAPAAPPRATTAPSASVAAAPPASIATAPAPSPNEDDAAVPISPRNPTWGSRDALVTIVEYADFECPYSARARAALAWLRWHYGPEKLRIVWKNDPLSFHPNARTAAVAAMGVFELAGADAFWRFHEALFANQTNLTEEHYERWAADAGVSDLASFRSGMASSRWADAVDADLREAKDLGARGTPSFYVNGTYLSGAQPMEKFTAFVDAELAKAQAKLDAGTPRARVYKEMARANYVVPAPSEHARDVNADTSTVFKVPLGTSPVLGSANALVTIVEFGDFQCPFTRRVEATLKALRVKYGDAIRLVWKNEPLPFHVAAEPAAEAALEVRREKGDKGFWQVHDELFASQQDIVVGKDLLTGKDADVDAIVRIAAETGADPSRISKAVTDHSHRGTLAADQDVADDFDANGTPHFFINGRRFVGAQPQERFEKIIDEEMEKARALLAKGTRPGDLYAVLTRDGKSPSEPEKKVLPPSLPANDPARGGLRARVVVHEWADFQCPFSGRVQPVLAQLLKDYGERVKLVWHDDPLQMHPDAALAAQAAREAYAEKGTSGFWALHDILFANQQRLKRADLDAYAQELGLDPGRWNGALDAATHAREIEADERGADDLGITGTPSFVIERVGAASGYYVNGAQSYDRFRRLVDHALGEGSPAPPPSHDR